MCKQASVSANLQFKSLPKMLLIDQMDIRICSSQICSSQNHLERSMDKKKS